MTQRIEDAVSKLFHAFGMVNAERVVAFLEAINDDCRCPTCIVLTAKKLAKTAPRMVTPAQFITSYRELSNEEHYRHVGQDTRAAEASTAEAFWRREAPKTIRDVYGCSPSTALLIGAQMWASTTVPPASGAIREECEQTRIWVDVAGEPSESRIERAFDLARAIATKDPADMSAGEWAEVTA